MTKNHFYGGFVRVTMNSSKFCFISVSLLSFCTSWAREVPCSNEMDRAALIELKNQITNDPNQIFSLWNATVDFFRWLGVTCGCCHPHVSGLELWGSRLRGSLSPYIGNLSFLGTLDINNNGFTGELLQEIRKLHWLLCFSLENNLFSGQFPKNISAKGSSLPV